MARVCNGNGEGASLFTVTREGGRKEFDPFDVGPIYSKLPIVGPPADGEELVRVPRAPAPNSVGPDDDDVTHLVNWLQASNRVHSQMPPSTTVSPTPSSASWLRSRIGVAGRLYWDPINEKITDVAV